MNIHTDGKSDGCTDRWFQDEKMNGWTKQINGWRDRWMNVCIDYQEQIGWMDHLNGLTTWITWTRQTKCQDGWFNEWIDQMDLLDGLGAYLNGMIGLDEWMERWIDRWMHACIGEIYYMDYTD